MRPRHSGTAVHADSAVTVQLRQPLPGNRGQYAPQQAVVGLHDGDSQAEGVDARGDIGADDATTDDHNVAAPRERCTQGEGVGHGRR